MEKKCRYHCYKKYDLHNFFYFVLHYIGAYFIFRCHSYRFKTSKQADEVETWIAFTEFHSTRRENTFPEDAIYLNIYMESSCFFSYYFVKIENYI